ncbi:MAG: hypothetical protein Q8M01_13175 [Rubrivivax sp.]|nr:hypothetical protein [Rubrivivax sp.]
MLTPVLGQAMGALLPAKALGVFVLLAPPAFVMGMMFPLDHRAANAGRTRTIRP